MEMTVIQNDELTMSSRDIAKLTKKRHDNVLRDIRNMFEQLGVDGELKTEFVEKINNLGFKVKEPYYLLNRRECEILVTGYDVVRRAAVIDRWFQLESAQRNNAPVLPKTFAEALQLAADQARQIELQKQQLAITAPKVEFAERIEKTDNGIKLGEFAKAVNLGPKKIFAILRDMKILISGRQGYNLPMQHLISAGYFAVRQSTYGPNNEYVTSTTLITGKGELWLTQKLVKKGVLKAVAK